MGNMNWVGAARTMIRSLDKKQSLDRKRRCSTMLWSCLIMGTCSPSRPPSRPLLGAPPQPHFLCSVLLRMMSLVAAMHLWELCIEVRGDSWGGERSSLLLVVEMFHWQKILQRERLNNGFFQYLR